MQQELGVFLSGVQLCLYLEPYDVDDAAEEVLFSYNSLRIRCPPRFQTIDQIPKNHSTQQLVGLEFFLTLLALQDRKIEREEILQDPYDNPSHRNRTHFHWRCFPNLLHRLILRHLLPHFLHPRSHFRFPPRHSIHPRSRQKSRRIHHSYPIRRTNHFQNHYLKWCF